MRAINLIQIPNPNLNLKILIWKTNKDICTICRMSKNIKQIYTIKNIMKPNLPLIFFHHLMPTSWASLHLLADIMLEQLQKSQDEKFDSTTLPSTKSTPSTTNQNATKPFHSCSTSLSPTNLSSPSQNTENSQAQPVKQQGSTSWTE